MAGRRITHSEEWWLTAPAHIMRCTATLKSGSPCRREAHPGTNVCGHHGALIPAVQAAAANRIQMSVDDAVKQLLRMLSDPEVEARDKIRVLHDFLDRGGLAPTSKHLIAVVEDPVEKLFMSLLSDPANFSEPRSALRERDVGHQLPQADDVFAELNRRTLEADDDPRWGEVVTGEVVEPVESSRELPSPDRSALPWPEAPAHTVDSGESASSRPPDWLARDLERLL